MSEPTLYQEPDCGPHPHDGRCLICGAEQRWVVPMERCEHDYDREHIIDGTIAIDTGPWSDVPRIGFDRCPGPGAGIGGDDVA